MNCRLLKLLAAGAVPARDAVWIDAYNQCVSEDIAGTITTRSPTDSNHFVTELQMNRRLAKMIDNGLIPAKDGVWIDGYNQNCNETVAGTITTRIDRSSHYFITEIMKQTPINALQNGEISPCITAHYHKAGGTDFMPRHKPGALPHVAVVETEDEPKIQNIGSYNQNGHCSGKCVDANGIAPTVMENHGMVTSVVEPNIQPLVPWSKPGNATDICPTITTSAFESNNVVVEPKIIGYSRDGKGKVVGHHLKDDSNTLTANGGGSTRQYVMEAALELKEVARTRRSSEIDVSITSDNNLRVHRNDPKSSTCSEYCVTYEDKPSDAVVSAHPQHTYGYTTAYRIRKLTPRECLRLMAFSERSIDAMINNTVETKTKSGKIKVKPMAKTQLYKQAGNSIVCDVLFHIGRTLWIDGQPENENGEPRQMSLFD